VLLVRLLVPKGNARNGTRPVRLAYQPPASSTFLSEQTSHQQPASSIFLSEQTSTSHQPPAKRTGCELLNSRQGSVSYFSWNLEGHMID
jgi:hypothetical protein